MGPAGLCSTNINFGPSMWLQEISLSCCLNVLPCYLVLPSKKCSLVFLGYLPKHCLFHLLSCGITFRLSLGLDKGSACSHFSWHKQETRCCLESTSGNPNSQYDCGLTTAALSHFVQGSSSMTSDLVDGMVPPNVTWEGKGDENILYVADVICL